MNMTAGELIEELQKVTPNTEVQLYTDAGWEHVTKVLPEGSKVLLIGEVEDY